MDRAANIIGSDFSGIGPPKNAIFVPQHCMNMTPSFSLIFGLGTSELIIILVVVLLLFGGTKIPQLMRGLGRGVKEFKDASKGVESEPTDKKD